MVLLKATKVWLIQTWLWFPPSSLASKDLDSGSYKNLPKVARVQASQRRSRIGVSFASVTIHRELGLDARYTTCEEGWRTAFLCLSERVISCQAPSKKVFLNQRMLAAP